MKTRLLNLTVIIVAAMLWSCGSNNDIPVSKDPQMLKLAAPVLVNSDSTVIELSDYFRYPGKIDSLMCDPALTVTISADSTTMVIKPLERNFPRLSALQIWSKGFSSSLILEKSTKIHYRFSFDPKNKKFKRVQLAGQMNDWNPAAGYMFQKDGIWVTDLFLFPGKYQYKLVLDGKWRTDPENRDSVFNNSDGFNSLLTLGNLNQTGLPVLFSKETGGRNIVLGLKNKTDSIFILWENHLLDRKFWKKDSSGISIGIPKKAKEYGRSYIRVFAYNNLGTSNQVLIPLHNGKVMTDPANLSREDLQAMIMYFLMVDRFRNGKPENDAPVKDSLIHWKVNYMGGDLAGVTKEIEDGYFTGLGINTLWISPITQNPLAGYVEYPAPHRKFSGYHGYWPVTLTTVDTRFGTPDELRLLVDEAHNKGINVVLDFVAHHVHQEYPVLQVHPDWITPVDLPGKRKNIRLFDEQRLTTWFDVFLPTFDLTKPEVAEMVSDSALFWIKTYKLDGFRHDAAKHVPESFWRLLTRKMNQEVVIPEGRNVYQIGETFGSRELVGSYINPGMLDAQFEFNLYWDTRSAFIMDNVSFRDLNYSLQQSFAYFGEHNLMGNITGNQDMCRIMSYASGAVGFSENASEAGWKRDIGVKDTTGYRKLASLIAFNMTIPGIPVIYYGDEYGMAGGGDPDNRRMMQFDSLDNHQEYLKSVTSKLSHLRQKNLALIYGDFTTIKVTDRIFIYMRSYFDKAVFVVFNKDKSARPIEFEIPARFTTSAFHSFMGSAITTANGKIITALEGNSFEIIMN